MQDELHFDVSAGLKSVIGRDLITNDEVAIFELVKNSFDANARSVQLYFGQEGILVVDDGDGMSLEDIKGKWLQVAYSSKSSRVSGGFREAAAEKKHFAGSKGIGRFSSDRLGETLVLQTRSAADSFVNHLEINWALFDDEPGGRFEDVPLNYSQEVGFSLPAELKPIERGTAITIRSPRLEWDRARIKQLKRSLAKLINPFGAESDGFTISVCAPGEQEEDDEIRRKLKGDEGVEVHLINGNVGNFIFESLREKTTQIRVVIDGDGSEITTSLIDRGELVYSIREKNAYPVLARSGFSCELYYLNQSAKLTFARRMGVPSVQFGSVFLFRNGFRVFPVGEEGDDTFGVDRRKQQGYARYLGSRDIIGRIDVFGGEHLFREASSRNGGLINTPAVDELIECFWEKCLKRLERYVVPVTWADKGEKNTSDLSRLLTDSGKERVTAAFAKLVQDEDIEVLDYSRNLISAVNERSQQFESSLDNLRAIALKVNDASMLQSLDAAEGRFAELRKAEADALTVAEEERLAKERAERDALHAKRAVEAAELELIEERSRNLFLASITSVDVDNVMAMHHQINIYANDLLHQVDNCIASARKSNGLTVGDAEARLEQFSFVCRKILSISKMATRANFRMQSEQLEEDIAVFFESYINDAARPFLSNISISVRRNNVSLPKIFRPMEVAVIADNLINNAKKAGATQVDIEMGLISKDEIYITFSDNGRGIDRTVSDTARVFEMGFSRTSGSGLGLYHVRQALGEMGGSINVKATSSHGTSFELRIEK
ncbi:ATP-binding protein [Stenotrophomonas indicatrix]|uniref:ATP-binding protein n=1 Tax=Stenotrophomonas indicatrix TaxID=2045451 RepID=UPI0015DDD6CC|nr:ATP-binding protein [Stenotrophomonas indicatrix]MBA0100332.1 ATP-binding protein [Stenotrophomonas indicatrix]